MIVLETGKGVNAQMSPCVSAGDVALIARNN